MSITIVNWSEHELNKPLAVRGVRLEHPLGVRSRDLLLWALVTSGL